VIEILQQEGGSFAPPASTLGEGPGTNASTQQPTGNGGTAGGQAQSPTSGLWMLGLMFLVVYLFLIRPERKRQRDAQQMRDAIKKGDSVVTAGGIHGKVASMDEATITLEVAEKVRMKFNRNAVAAVASSEKKAEDKADDAK